jgi:hypothetical protein
MIKYKVLTVCVVHSKELSVIIYYNVLLLVYNRIGGVMVSMLASNVVDRVFDLTDRVKLKTIKLVSVASLLSTQHSGERAKTGQSWLSHYCNL